MKSLSKGLFALLAIALLGTGLTGCDDNPTTVDETPATEGNAGSGSGDTSPDWP